LRIRLQGPPRKLANVFVLVDSHGVYK